MQLLSSFDIHQVSGANEVEQGTILDLMGQYSFYSTMLGGVIAGSYVMTNTVVGSLQILHASGHLISINNSILPMYFSSLGIFWVLGAAVGAGIAAYNAL